MEAKNFSHTFFAANWGEGISNTSHRQSNINQDDYWDKACQCNGLGSRANSIKNQDFFILSDNEFTIISQPVSTLKWVTWVYLMAASQSVWSCALSLLKPFNLRSSLITFSQFFFGLSLPLPNFHAHIPGNPVVLHSSHMPKPPHSTLTRSLSSWLSSQLVSQFCTRFPFFLWHFSPHHLHFSLSELVYIICRWCPCFTTI